jgi:Type II secretory pathway, pseudopilin PulG
MPQRPSPLAKQTAFTYVGLLILIVLISIALTATAELVSTAVQRDREEQLLFVGIAYAEAIDSYRRSSPGVRQFPTSLEELIRDPRFPNIRRHIRNLYRDPITESSDWGIVRGPANGIVGVYSKSEREPFKKEGFPRRYNQLEGAKTYADWQFLAQSLAEESGSDGAAADESRNRPKSPQSSEAPNKSPFQSELRGLSGDSEGGTPSNPTFPKSSAAQ